MRRAALLLLLITVALPAFSARPVTVEQLEHLLSADHSQRDAKLANQLAGLELNERLNSVRLARLEEELPGTRSRQILVSLADESAFLDPPAVEIPPGATPDLATQRQIMAKAVDYAGRTLRKLPNFFATRNTVFYEDSPMGRRPDSTLIPEEPLHPVNRFSDTVLYRDGAEVVDSGKVKRRRYDPVARALITRGVFGPLLGIALVDASHGSLSWSHWEQGAAGRWAVFRYRVPKEKSHYEVSFCCLLDDWRVDLAFRKLSGYHGEISIDPEDGSILRLTVVADLEPKDPIARSNILVEYGPVEIGGRSYICPVKSVSIWVAPEANASSLQTLLNDVVFADYHLFRSESRILVGGGYTP